MSARFPFTPREAFAFLVFGVAAGACLPFGTPAAPSHDPTVTDARTCAALAVYSMADDDWALRASVGAVVLNTYKPATHAKVCLKGTAAALEHEFSPKRWQAALDVVDAVQTGDYLLPTDCFLATRILPPGSDEPTSTTCVIQGYAFVRGEL